MIGELHIFVQDISSALSSSPCWAPWLWQLAWAEPCSSTASSYRTRGQCDSAVLSSQPPTFSVSARRPGPLLTTFLAGSSRGFSLSQPSRSSQSPGWTIWMSNDMKYILQPGLAVVDNFKSSVQCSSCNEVPEELGSRRSRLPWKWNQRKNINSSDIFMCLRK